MADFKGVAVGLVIWVKIRNKGVKSEKAKGRSESFQKVCKD
ncbi:MAG TPA: hypothetical protein VFG39_05460 [Balneolaceae bacterium]|nr:hypothetical protein [Balneolaceae bacterium]